MSNFAKRLDALEGAMGILKGSGPAVFGDLDTDQIEEKFNRLCARHTCLIAYGQIADDTDFDVNGVEPYALKKKADRDPAVPADVLAKAENRLKTLGNHVVGKLLEGTFPDSESLLAEAAEDLRKEGFVLRNLAKVSRSQGMSAKASAETAWPSPGGEPVNLETIMQLVCREETLVRLDPRGLASEEITLAPGNFQVDALRHKNQTPTLLEIAEQNLVSSIKHWRTGNMVVPDGHGGEVAVRPADLLEALRLVEMNPVGLHFDFGAVLALKTCQYRNELSDFLRDTRAPQIRPGAALRLVEPPKTPYQVFSPGKTRVD